MRLLVFDDEVYRGGVQTLCFNLLPALSRISETLVWAVPNYLCVEFQSRITDAPRLHLEGHNWPRRSLRCLPQRFLRKASAWVGTEFRSDAANSLRDARIRALARQYRCTHFLTSIVLSQPFPKLEQPVFGFVCDVNPAIPDRTMRNIGRWVGEARGIFGISEFTCRELRRMYPMQATKILPVPLAASARKAWNPEPTGSRRFDFYYPSQALPHKNHLGLFQACVRLAQDGWRFRLVLSGPGTNSFNVNGRFTNPQMEEARRFLYDHAALLGEIVDVVGDVDPPVVEQLYKQTRSVVLPSAYEGFGFPLAEAICRGIPIICSDIPAFREQLETYGPLHWVRIVPSGDPVRLAVAMEDFLKYAPDLLQNQEATECTSRWTWEDVAQRCFELLAAGTTNTPSTLNGG
jgi:glycosyltransferase involved in cell wall biosynthesis